MLIFNFGIFLLNNTYHVYNCMLTEIFLKIYLFSIIKLLRITNVNVFWFICIKNLLSQCGGIEANLGPRFSSSTFCHWNLNSHAAHDYIKILLFQAYISQHNYDIICLLGTFLNSFIQSDDKRIKKMDII